MNAKSYTQIAFTIFIAISIASVTGCSVYEDSLDKRYAPIERIQPKQILRISGNKSPSLSIAITVQYMTANKSCDRLINWLEGATSPRIRLIEIPVQQTSNSFETTVALDKFEEGACKWLPWDIGYIVKKDGVVVTMPVPPVPLVWIATPGIDNPLFAKDGVNKLQPFEVMCQEYSIDGKAGLGCQIPLGEYYITNDAKELHVNFLEQAWFKAPFHN